MGTLGSCGSTRIIIIRAQMHHSRLKRAPSTFWMQPRYGTSSSLVSSSFNCYTLRSNSQTIFWAIREKWVYSCFSPILRIKQFSSFQVGLLIAVRMAESSRREVLYFRRAEEADSWMNRQQVCQSRLSMGGVLEGEQVQDRLLIVLILLKTTSSWMNLNLRNPNNSISPESSELVEVLKILVRWFFPTSLAFRSIKGSLLSKVTLKDTSLVSLLGITKPQFRRNLELHFLPQESNTSCPLSMSVIASITNPLSFWENTHEDCFGIRWLIMSAKGTNASVLLPSIVTPKILLQTAVLAQQNCLNSNFVLNPDSRRQIVSQSFLRSRTFSWTMNRKGDPSSISSSLLVQKMGKEGNSVGSRSMQGFHWLFYLILSSSRNSARKVCLGDMSSMFPSRIVLETLNSLAISRVIRRPLGIQRILSFLLMFLLAMIPLQFWLNSATISLSNTPPPFLSHCTISDHFSSAGVLVSSSSTV